MCKKIVSISGKISGHQLRIRPLRSYPEKGSGCCVEDWSVIRRNAYS